MVDCNRLCRSNNSHYRGCGLVQPAYYNNNMLAGPNIHYIFSQSFSHIEPNRTFISLFKNKLLCYLPYTEEHACFAILCVVLFHTFCVRSPLTDSFYSKLKNSFYHQFYFLGKHLAFRILRHK